MSRATIVLLILVVLIVVGLGWLSRKPVEVQPHRIEKVVTLEGAADAAK
jgi:preprotein translocase subunit SecG